jgi:hypothetical protein
MIGADITMSLASMATWSVNGRVNHCGMMRTKQFAALCQQHKHQGAHTKQ